MNQLSLDQIDFLISQNQTMLEYHEKKLIKIPQAEALMAQNCILTLQRQRTQLLKYKEEEKRRQTGGQNLN